MINDINKIIANLLHKELKLSEPESELGSKPECRSGIKLIFTAPDQRFFQEVTPPLIDIFLYDIRENLSLRMSESLSKQTVSTDKTTATLMRSPIPIDYSYLITAWASCSSNETTFPDVDQHTMLSQVLHALLRYPTWPAALLQGKLASHPLPKAFVAQPSHLQNMGEFWSAMGGQPRPALHYTVTVPLYAHEPIKEQPLIQNVAHQTKAKNK